MKLHDANTNVLTNTYTIGSMIISTAHCFPERHF